MNMKPTALLPLMTCMLTLAVLLIPESEATAAGQIGGDLDLRLPFSDGEQYRCSQDYAGISHTGFEVDFALPEGTTVVAAASGTVDLVDNYQGLDCRNNNGCGLQGNDTLGRFVRIRHTGKSGKSWTSTYAHLSSRSVGNGAIVTAGQVIGRSGNTGWSTGAHLHLHMRDSNGLGVRPVPMAGIEVGSGTRVINDFVFNKTYQAIQLGPTLPAASINNVNDDNLAPGNASRQWITINGSNFRDGFTAIFRDITHNQTYPEIVDRARLELLNNGKVRVFAGVGDVVAIWGVVIKNSDGQSSAEKRFAVTVTERYTLTVTGNPAGSGTISANPPPGTDGKYAAGTAVTLTPDASAGYSFSSWGGDAAGNNNKTTVSMDGNRNVTASFAVTPQRYALTMSVNPAGSGSINFNPQPGGDGKYAGGTVVTLTSNPSAGYAFNAWGGDVAGNNNPTTVSMNGNRNVTAGFAVTPQRYALSLSVNPAGSGSIGSNPQPGADGKYAAGTVVTLSSNPSADYGFSGWGGDAFGAANQTTVTMSGNKSATATFTRAPPPPPGKATNPIPSEGAIGQSLRPNLQWQGPAGAAAYGIYFGTVQALGAAHFQDEKNVAQWTPPNLDYSRTYYWRVDVKNAAGQITEGDVWRFTTMAAPPLGKASNPTPANGAIDQALRPNLQWQGSADTVAYRIYLGTSQVLGAAQFQDEKKVAQWTPPNLDYSTTYYWRIDVMNAAGQITEGDVWFFTTLVVENRPPNTPSNLSPPNGAIGQSLTPTIQSSAFNDPDGDAHIATQWQVFNSSGNGVIWDSGEDAVNKTSRSVPAGYLANSATYRWQVRYKDSRGAWSNYSQQTSFTATDQQKRPIVSTLRPTLVTSNSARLWGRVVNDGGSSISERALEWGSASLDEVGGDTKVTIVGTDFYLDVNGLSPGKSYEFIALAENAAGWGVGETMTFTTLSGPAIGKADFDRDGKPDILFQDAAGFVATWLMNGATLQSASFLTPSNVGDLNYRVSGTGDFNRDGQEDILFQHTDGTLAVWYMNRTSQTGAELLKPSNPGDRNWRVAAVADLNKDGKMDIVFQHTDGTLAVWFMNGINLSSASLLSPSNPGDRNWRVIGVGDFNADGDQDLAFQHTDGTLAVWHLNGTALKQTTLLSPSNPGDSRWRAVGVVDRNGDGKVDLLFQHSDYSLAVWSMNGVTLSSAQLLSPSNSGATWRVVGPK